MELSDDQILKSMCKRMKEIRTEKSMTQLQVAEKCDMEKSAYQRIEKGRSSPTLKNVLKILRAMDSNMNDLFDFEH